jgi:hypothetical protein
MPDCRFVRGLVVEQSSARPLPNLLVRITQGQDRAITMVGEGQTDQAGRFVVNLGPDVDGSAGEYDVQVLRGEEPLRIAGDVRWTAAEAARDMVVCVVPRTPCTRVQERLPKHLQDGVTGVYGLVRHANGTPLPGLRVQPTALDFAGERSLTGAATTDAEGWYELGELGAKVPLDLILKIFDPSATASAPRLLGGSAVQYHYAGGVLRLDIELCDESLRGPSECARLTQALSVAVFPGGGRSPYG